MNAVALPETVAIGKPDPTLMRSVEAHLAAARTATSITTLDECERAADELRRIRARAKELEEVRTSITRPLLEAQRAVNELFREPQATLAAADALIKRLILDFQEMEEAKRRASEALAAEALRRQREKLEERAAKAQASGRLERAEALRVNAATLPLALPQAPSGMAGLATKSTWRAEVADLQALIRYVAEHPEWAHLLEANLTALNGLARSQKSALAIPGVRVVEEKQLAARRT